MGVFIIANCGKPSFEFYWDATDHFSAYPRSLKEMFMSRENLGSSRTRRFRVEETPTDISITKTTAFRRIKPQGRYSNMYGETPVKGTAWPRTRNIFVRPTISTTPNTSGRFSVRNLTNLKLQMLLLFSMVSCSKCRYYQNMMIIIRQYLLFVV